jgi:hypothetical protein
MMLSIVTPATRTRIFGSCGATAIIMNFGIQCRIICAMSFIVLAWKLISLGAVMFVARM